MKVIGELSLAGSLKIPIIKREFKVDHELLKKSSDPDSLIERAFMDSIKDEINIDCWYTK